MGWTTWAIQFAALLPLALVVLHTVRRFLRNRVESKGHPFPPGPIRLPLLGNALAVNAQRLWLSFTKWRAKYGKCIAKAVCVP